MISPDVSTAFSLARLLATRPIVAAPLAGITDYPFRRLIREFTDGLIHTEMISTEAVSFRSPRTDRMMETLSKETPPVGIQIMGAREESLRRAIPRIMALAPALIDINMACPVPKIVRSGGGAALLKNPDSAARLIRAARAESGIEVTAKIRLGFRSDEAEQIMAPLIEAGVAGLTIHGRTAVQQYGGRAARARVLALARAAPIPIICSGDVHDVADVTEILAGGARGVLVARGMLGRPWFLSIAAACVAGNALPRPPSRRNVALRHLAYVIEYHGEAGIPPFRRHLVEYARALPGAPAIRHALVTAKTSDAVRQILEGLPE